MRVTVEDGLGKKVVIDGAVPALRDASADWDGTGFAGRLIKSAPARQYTLCIAYPALKADVKVAQDGYRDFVGPDALEDAAWSYLTKGAEVGLWHAHGTEKAGRVVESYIYRGPQWVVKGANGEDTTVNPGDWLVGIIWGDQGWAEIQKGRVNGVSMQGDAARRKPDRETLKRLRR